MTHTPHINPNGGIVYLDLETLEGPYLRAIERGELVPVEDEKKPVRRGRPKVAKVSDYEDANES